MHKLTAFTLVLILSLGNITFAQEVAATPPADPPAAIAPDRSSSTDASVPVDTPAETVTDSPSTADVVQSTDSPLSGVTTTQDTIDAMTLEATLNPEVTSNADVIPIATSTNSDSSASTTLEMTTPQSDASSTPFEVSASADDGGTPLDTTQPLNVVDTSIAVSDTPQSLPVQKTEGTKIAIVSAKNDPGPTYTFSLGKKIATQRIEKDQSGREHIVQNAASIDPVIDNASGTMHLSGSCNNIYFVILLFRDPEDYARDPQSFILNKAFPCIGGSFTYDIADLPDSLPNGTYYLLVGAEGDRGPWTPITSLTEITLSRNHH